MEFLINVLKFGIAWFAGVIPSVSISVIGCCLFCGLPILRDLTPHKDCILVGKAKWAHLKTIFLHCAIIALESYAVVTFAPKIMCDGFFLSIAFFAIISCRKWGRSEPNLSDFCAFIQKYVVPGREQEAAQAVLAVLADAERNRAESKLKKFARGTAATLLLWILCKGTLFAANVWLGLPELPAFVASLLFLVAGWFITGSVVRWKSPGCMIVNLYLFVSMESIVMAIVAWVVMQNMEFYTGGFYCDPYGVPYSQYPIVYGGIILKGAIYIAVCYILARATKKRAPGQQESQN